MVLIHLLYVHHVHLDDEQDEHNDVAHIHDHSTYDYMKGSR